MAAGSSRVWAYLAAGVLAVLTLAVFDVLQDYGPESTIRRFHTAVLNNDLPELRRVTRENVETLEVARLAATVQAYHARGYHYQLVKMDRTPTKVNAALVYSQGEDKIPMIWVVEKVQGLWKVDAILTSRLMRESLGMGLNEQP